MGLVVLFVSVMAGLIIGIVAGVIAIFVLKKIESKFIRFITVFSITGLITTILTFIIMINTVVENMH